MARIGDYIDAGLNRYDPGDFMRGSALSAASVQQSLQQGVGAITDAMDKRKEYKDQLKTGKDLAKAMKVLYPELAPVLDPTIAEMDNEENPLSQRASLGNNAATLINAYIRKGESDRAYSLDLAASDRADRGLALDERRGEIDVQRITNAMQQEQQEAASKAELTQFMARPLLEQALNETARAEKRGEKGLIDVAALKRAFNKSPEQQMQIASAALAGLPKPQPVELRNIKFTRDGQPMEGTGYFDPNTGSMRLLPVQDDSAPSNLAGVLPASLAPFAADFEAAGAKYGVDPKVLAAISMHETANGTSSAFKNKNNAMGVSNASGPVAMDSVPASIERMARLLGSTESGPYKNASTVGEIAGVYAPVGAGNDPRNLNQYWTRGVSENLRKLGGDPTAPVRIQPGASTAAAKTPTEQAIDEARLGKLQAETKAKDAELTKQTDMKATAAESARGALGLIDKLRKHPGFSSAVGVSLTPGFVPATDRKGAEAIIDQLKGHAFLNAIQQLRGLGALSDAEGAKLQQAAVRLDANQSEKDFKEALADYERVVNDTLARIGDSAASSGVSAADRLRAMIPAR